VNTKESTVLIAQWIIDNPGMVPCDDFAVGLKNSGNHWISDGTDPKAWKRLTKKKLGEVEYRLFHCPCSIFGTGLKFLLSGSEVSYGPTQSFQDHPAVGPWVKNYCGITE
jgi:hypothetical protein